ncbi:MAG: CheR family methyltransferase [Gemmatimonadota bacterium]
MDRRVFDKLRSIIYEKSGIALHDGKEALVSARIRKRMRVLGIQDYREYLRRVSNDGDGAETVGLIDAISTNVTSFFREPAHFEFLGKLMTDWMAAGQARFRFWSAACASGEEPYSIAMTLLEAMNGQAVDMKILATDISTQALAKAIRGRYDEQRMSFVPALWRNKYFDRVKGDDGVSYLVKAGLAKPILFRWFNLTAVPFPMSGPLDAIFCRNVLIYFDQATRKRLLDEMHRLLRRGGYLMVGHAESLTGMISDFKSLRPSVYIKE